jgi:hypothetical protein
MKILPYYLYDEINEINYGKVKSYSFNKYFKEKNNIKFIDIEIENDKNLTVEIKEFNVNDFIFSKENISLNNFVKEFNKNINTNIGEVSFYLWNKNLNRYESDFGEMENDFKSLFRKMKTIIDIVLLYKEKYNVNWFIFKSAENDPLTGLTKNYNKRDKFYDTYLNYHNIFNVFITKECRTKNNFYKNFYLINI